MAESKANLTIARFFDEFFRQVNDQWVRGELGKQETSVAVIFSELEIAIWDSYVTEYNKKQKRFQNNEAIKGETDWPHPFILKDELNTFNRAAMAAMKDGRKYVETRRFILDPQDSGGNEILAFWTPVLTREFFRIIKTAALDILSKDIASINENQVITNVQGLMDNYGYDEKDAKRVNENWKLRSNIHITHQGFTTTGGAVGAVALQAIDKLFKGRIERTDIQQLFGDIASTYEITTLEKYFRVALKKGKDKVRVNVGSFLINAQKKEAADLSEYKEDFIKLLQKLLSKIPEDKLLEILGESNQQIAKNVGALVTKSIAEQLTSKQVTQRTDLIKWAKSQKIPLSRAIGPQKYLKAKTKGEKKVVSPRKETQAFEELSSVRAERLYMALKVNLREHIVMNMGHGTPPSRTGPLVYRTGRFADNVRIEKVFIGADALPVVRYDYMKYPYQVFEPGHTLGNLNPNWDPYKLINKSVREIAKEIEITKLRVPRTGALQL